MAERLKHYILNIMYPSASSPLHPWILCLPWSHWQTFSLASLQQQNCKLVNWLWIPSHSIHKGISLSPPKGKHFYISCLSQLSSEFHMIKRTLANSCKEIVYPQWDTSLWSCFFSVISNNELIWNIKLFLFFCLQKLVVSCLF